MEAVHTVSEHCWRSSPCPQPVAQRALHLLATSLLRHPCKLHEVAGSSHYALQASQRTPPFCQRDVFSDSPPAARADLEPAPWYLAPQHALLSMQQRGPVRTDALCLPDTAHHPTRQATPVPQHRVSQAPASQAVPPLQLKVPPTACTAPQLRRCPAVGPGRLIAEPLRSACQLATWHQ